MKLKQSVFMLACLHILSWDNPAVALVLIDGCGLSHKHEIWYV